MEILDFSNPSVHEAMEVLGISKEQLKQKTPADFFQPGINESIQDIRYKYYLKSYKQYLKSIKDYMKSNESKSRSLSALDSRASESVNSISKPKTAKQIREKYKLELLNYFKTDSYQRQVEENLLSSSQLEKKALKIKEKLQKQKLEKAQKLSLQKSRYSSIQKEYREQMHTLNEKLSKSTKSTQNSQSGSFNKWRESSKLKVEKLSQEEEKQLLLKLELYNKKQSQSVINYGQALETKSRRVYQHNIKVDRIKNSISVKANEEEQVIGILAKNQSVVYKREKRKNELYKKVQEKKKECAEMRMKIDKNKIDKQESCIKKLANIEKKYFKSAEMIKKKKMNWESNLEIIQEMERLKIEDGFEKLQRNKRLELKNKEEIIRKHVDIDNRLKSRKSIQEKNNEKLRDSAMKESIERDRARNIKLKISKSKAPVNFQSVISELD